MAGHPLPRSQFDLVAHHSLPIVDGTRASRAETAPPRPARWGERGGFPQLVDGAGRRYEYLRLSVTDRCDMACVYCMPPGGEAEHAARPELLTFEEIVRLTSIFVRAGVRRVRLTGGEPLVRKDAVVLVRMLAESARASEIVMTTNASRLAALAAPLRAAGLRGVNVSLDSLRRDRFAEITRGGDLDAVLAGIRRAIDVGLEVKLNTIPLGGINDDELGDIVDFAWSIGATPRFIELMPLGEAATLPRATFLGARDAIARLDGRVEWDSAWTGVAGRGPARYAAERGGARRVGIITAISDDFCDGCNRVRVTARGDMRACLASRRAVSLRDRLRSGAGDVDLVWAAAWSLGSKESGHGFVDPSESEHTHVGMSLIGG